MEEARLRRRIDEPPRKGRAVLLPYVNVHAIPNVFRPERRNVGFYGVYEIFRNVGSRENFEAVAVRKNRNVGRKVHGF